MRRVAAGTIALLVLVFPGAACTGVAGTGEADPAPVVVAPPLESVPTTRAEEDRAARLYTRARDLFDQGATAMAREMAEEVVRDLPGTASSSRALWLAARAALLEGDMVAARTMAERYAGLFPADDPGASPARELIARLDSIPAEAAPAAEIRIGVVIPRTGSPVLERYGELVLEGVQLAARRFEEREGARVRLQVEDDGGDPRISGRRVAELEREGVAGVVGPLLSDALRFAGSARHDSAMPVVSPTASAAPAGVPNVYTLNAPDTRGAEALAEHVAEQGLGRAAVLYPRVPDAEEQARAFARRLAEAGAGSPFLVPYDSGTTSFGEPIRAVRASGARALFVPAPERDVRQIAPQLTFFGIPPGSVQVLGGEAWATGQMLRLVEPRFLEGVIAAIPLHRDDPDVAWGEFVELYEETHRRSLDNHYPALGYDAAMLILEGTIGARDGTVSQRTATPATWLAELRDYRGASGIYSVTEGRLDRRPFLVRIEEGRLVPLRPRDAPSSERQGSLVPPPTSLPDRA